MEQLLLANWQLQGFLGSMRVRVPTTNGHWKELDAVATGWSDEGAILMIGEVKIRGEANNVYVLNPDSNVLTWISDWQWGSFIEAFAALYPAGNGCAIAGYPPWDQLAKIHIEFVVNGIFEPGREDETQQKFAKVLKERLRLAWDYEQRNPSVFRKLDVKIRTSLDLITDTVLRVRTSTQNRGSRFGDAILDVMRELVRYMANPKFDGIRRGGAAPSEYREDILGRISGAFGPKSEDV